MSSIVYSEILKFPRWPILDSRRPFWFPLSNLRLAPISEVALTAARNKRLRSCILPMQLRLASASLEPLHEMIATPTLSDGLAHELSIQRWAVFNQRSSQVLAVGRNIALRYTNPSTGANYRAGQHATSH